ncbi:M23 family metallopeptidase [Klugiella xanthotipulae]|uniref:M23 family metallopeptidase n=1 Tax=Klugiella xanthotipulae TaxID=244735 RepID=UPI001477209F|nr:M23 family metallopeptidase [Klugiella xanthotipulae]
MTRRPHKRKTLILRAGACALLMGSLTISAVPLTATATESAHHPRWQLPVIAPLRVSRPFIAPEHRYAAGHRGVDLAVTEAAPVTAPAAGVVHFVGLVVDRPVLSIQHANGYLSSFEPVNAVVVAGQLIAAGEPVGTVGTSTHCSETLGAHTASGCLHMGVRVEGDYLNPMIFFGLDARPVLLPLDGG